MTGRPLIEFELEDATPTVYLLGPETRHALEISGLGMPPVRHWTTRSPYQHGRTHWGYAFQPRVVDIILATQGCHRSGMYAGRAANVEMLNPMNGPLKLRLKVPQANLVYELHDGWYVGNYELTSADQSQDVTGMWNQIGAASIEFEDPIWKWVNSPLDGGETRDADGRTCVTDSTWTLVGALVLPFVGPYLLGTTTATNVLTCTNDGSWETKPLITMLGPIEDFVISNATNGDLLMWDGYSVAGGETITIDIVGKTCTTDLGGATTDVSTYLSGDTGSFALDPGANTINVFASGGVTNAVTTVAVCWYVELLGT
jgi:hypothetical protein